MSQSQLLVHYVKICVPPVFVVTSFELILLRIHKVTNIMSLLPFNQPEKIYPI